MMITVLCITALIMVPVSIVIYFILDADMKKTQRIQEERESKWCGGAR